jgi:hypothetical protein
MAQYGVNPPVGVVEASPSQSGVSWGAIFAGAAGAASLSLVLLLLGTGLGMSSISPWSSQGASAATIGIATILWLSFMQLAASGLGGYLAGRLRTKWAGIHTDEVFFRDTAHGFLAWAVATLLTAGLLSSVVGSILGTGAQAGASVAGGAAAAVAAAGAGAAAGGSQAASGNGPGPMSYHIDALFRQEPRGAGSVPAVAPASAAPPVPAAPGAASTASASLPIAITAPPPPADPAAASAEVGRIFANGMRDGALPAEDTRYAAQLVAQRTGLSQLEAEKRVNDIFAKARAARDDAEAKAKQAADAARKASAYASLWMVVSLFIGAFVASFAATYGGRRRDL